MPCLNASTTEVAYLRRQGAARYLNVSPSLLDKLHRLSRGPLRITLPGSRVPLYPIPFLRAWVEAKKGQTK